MAITRSSADLTNAQFPFNFQELSSTVIFKSAAEIASGTPNGFDGADNEQQQGIPQAYYMENVLPLSRGFSSVHYTEMLPPIPGVVGTVYEWHELRGDAASLALLAVTEEKQYIYDALKQEWKDVTIKSSYWNDIFVANIKEVCYIFVFGKTLYTYDFGAQTLTEVEALGLDLAAMAGMMSAGAIMVFWDIYNRIYTSSIYDPLDFVPSLSTGAGSTAVVGITSKITSCESLGNDFIIYTKTNAVSARYTNDVQFPFVYDTIKNSEGVYERNHIAWDTNSESHVVWTGHNFQEVNVQSAQYLFPELSQGISRGLRITLDPLTEQPVLSRIDKWQVALQFCTNNYLCISLKQPSDPVYTEAFIWDTSLKRWGRVVVDHVALFDNPIVRIIGGYTYDELETDYAIYNDLDTHGLVYYHIDSHATPEETPVGVSFSVLGVDGRIHTGAPSETQDFRGQNVGIDASVPRIFFGRFKLVRDQGYWMQGFITDGFLNGRAVAHGHLYNGKFIRKVEQFDEVLQQPGYYHLECAADSVSLEFNGTFRITSLLLEGSGAGGNNQYGVPVAKKLYSYISSVPYPLFITEDMQGLAAGVEGTVHETYWIDDISSVADLMEGILRDISQLYNCFDVELFSSVADIVDGALVTVNINVAFTVYDIDRFTGTATLQSGTLVQTLFSIAYTVYDIDRFTGTATLQSGTLI